MPTPAYRLPGKVSPYGPPQGAYGMPGKVAPYVPGGQSFVPGKAAHAPAMVPNQNYRPGQPFFDPKAMAPTGFTYDPLTKRYSKGPLTNRYGATVGGLLENFDPVAYLTALKGAIARQDEQGASMVNELQRVFGTLTPEQQGQIKQQYRDLGSEWHNSPYAINERAADRARPWFEKHRGEIMIASIIGGAALGGAFGAEAMGYGAGAGAGAEAGAGAVGGSSLGPEAWGAGTAAETGTGMAETAGVGGGGNALNEFGGGSNYLGDMSPYGGTDVGGTVGAGDLAPTVPVDTGGSAAGGYFDPTGGWHGGMPGGDFGAAAPGASSTSAFDRFFNQYGKYIGAGTTALGRYEQARITRDELARAKAAAEANRSAALSYASPENYNKLYEGYLGKFQEAYKPALLNTGEALALGEQGNLEAFKGDVARRNLEGSGMAFAGENAIRGGRQAAYGQAVRGYYTSAADAARNAAAGTQNLETSTSLGAPVPYVPKGPSATQTGIDVLGGALGSYEAIQSRQNASKYGMAPYMGYYYSGQGPGGEGYYPGYAQPYNG